MRLPALILQHTVSTEPKTGEGAYGASYAEPRDVAVWFDGKQGTTRAADGSTVATSGTVLAQREDVDHFPVGSRVTYLGRIFWVLSVTDHDPGRLPLPGHLEIAVG